MNVKLTATYDRYRWDGDEDEYPSEEGGFTDPLNPWGGFKVEIPEDVYGAAFAPWAAENVEEVTVTLLEAARLVVDFPGAVWDYSEGEGEMQGDGSWMSVTLHVNDHPAAVFALADLIRDGVNL